jgi:hypothetical protein
LLAQVAAQLLGAHLRVKVILETEDGMRFETVLEPGERLPVLVEGVAEAPPGWRPCSPLEVRIVGQLRAAGGWMTTAELAQALGENYNATFRTIIANLADQDSGIIESNTRHGVRLRRVADSGTPG